jgi:ferredoxin
MGWLYSDRWTRRGLVAHLIEDWSNQLSPTDRPFYVAGKCLKHCYRGNAFSGVLWVVWETQRLSTKDDTPVKDPEKWIACYLLKCVGGEWGYKDMEESMGPCYYSCPLGYLDMVTENTNEEWRKKVREYHDRRKLKFKPEIGKVLKMREGVNPQYIRITSTKPFRGVDKFGGRWRIVKKHVEEQIEDFPDG